jgi:hypothetical protein
MDQVAYKKWDWYINIFSLPLILTESIRVSSVSICPLLIPSVFTNEIILASVMDMYA